MRKKQDIMWEQSTLITKQIQAIKWNSLNQNSIFQQMGIMLLQKVLHPRVFVLQLRRFEIRKALQRRF